MKVLAWFIVPFLVFGFVIAGTYYGWQSGERYGLQKEIDYVRATCESTEGNTQLNGQSYICLTPEQWAAIAKKLKERGV